MNWSQAVDEHIKQIKPVPVEIGLVQKLYHLLDLTSLNDNDTESTVAACLPHAISPLGHVAAVCVYPPFVRMAAAQFANTPVKVATVANFPSGDASLEDVLIEINRCVEDGANEIDVVFPYQRYLTGDRHSAHLFVETCKAACGEQVCLKVILETGVLREPGIIAEASFDILMAGADFIKTSTGKLSPGATLQAAAAMLMVIKDVSKQLPRPVGFKAAGGVRDIQTATAYLVLAENILGKEWVSPNTFRIGASQLIQELLGKLALGR